VNKLKNLLGRSDVSIGAWLQIPSTLSVQAMCQLGFDWIAIDMEHGSTAVSDAEQLFAIARSFDIDPLVRLPTADPVVARKLLDFGAAGFIVAGVEDAVAFSEFIQHCYYPPKGRRGVGLAAANDWGRTFDDYMEFFRPVIVPQIESVKGVEAAADLAGLPDVDALFLGPYDLSASIGVPGDFESGTFKEMVNRVLSACRENKVASGVHQVDLSPAQLEARIAEGHRFIAYGTDILAIRKGLSCPVLNAKVK